MNDRIILLPYQRRKPEKLAPARRLLITLYVLLVCFLISPLCLYAQGRFAYQSLSQCIIEAVAMASLGLVFYLAVFVAIREVLL